MNNIVKQLYNARINTITRNYYNGLITKAQYKKMVEDCKREFEHKERTNHDR